MLTLRILGPVWQHSKALITSHTGTGQGEGRERGGEEREVTPIFSLETCLHSVGISWKRLPFLRYPVLSQLSCLQHQLFLTVLEVAHLRLKC